MNDRPTSAGDARLVVNADDYGSFSCVSRGILEAARRGRVTATGVLANSPRFESHAKALRALPEVDAGVHLTLTSGRPLTSRMADILAPWGGRFPPDKARVALGVLAGQIPTAAVRQEWEAQVRRCLEAGLEVQFLNSHEHLHLLPSLSRAVEEIAATHGIRHVRVPRAEWVGRIRAGALARNLAFRLAGWLSPARRGPVLLGVAESGRLTLRYLERRFETLEAGRTYELMCHPGYLDPEEIQDPRLLSYHRWEQELELLTGDAFAALCARRGVSLGRYRELDASNPARPGEKDRP